MGYIVIILAFTAIVAVIFIVNRATDTAGDAILNVFVKKYNEKHLGEITKLRDRYPNYRPESTRHNNITSSGELAEHEQNEALIEARDLAFNIKKAESISKPASVRMGIEQKDIKQKNIKQKNIKQEGVLDALAEVEKDLGLTYSSVQFSQKMREDRLAFPEAGAAEPNKQNKSIEQTYSKDIPESVKPYKVIRFDRKETELPQEPYAAPPVQSGKQVSRTIFCTQCGFKIMDNYQFCPECGAIVRRK